jgi:spermidine synthase
MAIILRKTAGNRRLEVRSAGRTKRLYVDGVLHTQYNPRRRTAGSVWDLLVAPALFHPPERVRRVLVLGVGGGAVIHLLREYVRPDRIWAVDMCPDTLTIARNHFDVRGADLRIACDDARTWLATHKGPQAPRFDLIIDDLFTEADGEPRRSVAADAQWCGSLYRRLTRHGILVMNFADRGELALSDINLDTGRWRSRFPFGYMLTASNCDNAIGAFCRAGDTPQRMRRRLMPLGTPKTQWVDLRTKTLWRQPD